jgi:hypothetical protein
MKLEKRGKGPVFSALCPLNQAALGIVVSFSFLVAITGSLLRSIPLPPMSAHRRFGGLWHFQRPVTIDCQRSEKTTYNNVNWQICLELHSS